MIVPFAFCHTVVHFAQCLNDTLHMKQSFCDYCCQFMSTQTLFTVQGDLACTSSDLGLTTLTLCFEDANSKERWRREILEDCTEEVHQRCLQRFFPRFRKVLHKIAILLRVAKERKWTPSSPIIILLAFSRWWQNIRTIIREEIRDLFINNSNKDYLFSLTSLHWRYNIELS